MMHSFFALWVIAQCGATALISSDPTSSASYPLCAQICQNASLPSSGCGSLSNRACVCKSNLKELNTCEVNTCSASDYKITQDLAETLCSPVGGIQSNVSNATYSITASPPIPTAFSGGTTAVMKEAVGWSVVGLVGVLGWQTLL